MLIRRHEADSFDVSGYPGWHGGWPALEVSAVVSDESDDVPCKVRADDVPYVESDISSYEHSG